MSYKLFLDDEQFPVGEDWVVARSSQEALDAIKDRGIPSYISFDHDLGGEDTGMRFLNSLVDLMLDGGLIFPDDFDYYVYSQNPVGAENIRHFMESALENIRD